LKTLNFCGFIPFLQENSKRWVRKLQLLDDATSDADLRSPPGNHFEKLSGKLKDKCSIRVNNQWRIIFIWDEEHGDADGIYLDNHTYK